MHYISYDEAEYHIRTKEIILIFKANSIFVALLRVELEYNNNNKNESTTFISYELTLKCYNPKLILKGKSIKFIKIVCVLNEKLCFLFRKCPCDPIFTKKNGEERI